MLGMISNQTAYFYHFIFVTESPAKHLLFQNSWVGAKLQMQMQKKKKTQLKHVNAGVHCSLKL